MVNFVLWEILHDTGPGVASISYKAPHYMGARSWNLPALGKRESHLLSWQHRQNQQQWLAQLRQGEDV